MFGLTLEKLLLVGVVAVFLVGPEKLPHYAAMLGRVVRQLRVLASGASDRLRDEMGPDFDDVDWKKYDPRKYDPRRIIREALLDSDDAPPHSPSQVQPRTDDPLASPKGAEDVVQQEPVITPPATEPSGLDISGTSDAR
ncbi:MULTISPECIES: twin-arginine translocase TatA/TatE family subunit [unclassified Cryobacterium]|uniref:twin-arginine translocase TatA/TatE family subunit n=1 Tax=unclassified Cryobacterium TaxID=2649013 RepID=UPI002AB54198|nr:MULTISPECIES: twin-arginine translocase TatA/TatE family subunit [unclassified Cryobacterium]MDY7528394.1 twin-arginine translocase TatA/TatE family subunit [Cryobacterium sp. 10C2]MDY7555860.1 twin-arginine translocase TatA/TatE family subunit [Cryobacterium sp. 10C3]MEB0291343.1 twin-arginine translocase TatA/TatE family subunit [Cryobacterium sp. 10C2]